ncbi:hypothetical protein GCM10010420_14100 [Streptomyces glaucosporus]|uniref:Uncharacterized protein n=2 Tax=Streptomyces glaucosporus TaxID=284044 RepID=A0ABP5V2G6_9ACTN
MHECHPRCEMKVYGEYRTENLIFAEYDRMTAVGPRLENPLGEGGSGTYRSTLAPPHRQGLRHG